MNRRLTAILAALMLLTGCTGKKETISYQQISQEEARERMHHENVIILDVRELSEFEEGHIPGAVLLPVGTITKDTAAAVIPDFDTEVLVYCRSGNRSQTASSALAAGLSECI